VSGGGHQLFGMKTLKVCLNSKWQGPWKSKSLQQTQTSVSGGGVERRQTKFK